MINLLDFLIRNQFLIFAGSAALALLLVATGFVLVYVSQYVSQWGNDRHKRGDYHGRDDTDLILGRDLPDAPMPSPPRGVVVIGLMVPTLLIVLGCLEPIPKTAVLAFPELSRDS